MSISQLKKVTIVGHSSERDIFIKKLQCLALLHIEKVADSAMSELKKKNFLLETEVDHKLEFLNKILKLHAAYDDKKNTLQNILHPYDYMTRGEYSNLVYDFQPSQVEEKLTAYQKQLQEIERENRDLKNLKDNLEPWKIVDETPADFGETIYSFSVLGVAKADKKERTSSFYEISTVAEGKSSTLIMVAALKDEKAALKDFLAKIDFKELSYLDKNISIKNNYSEVCQKLKDNLLTEREIVKNIKSLLQDIKKIKALIHYYESLQNRSKLAEKWVSEENYFVLNGWLRARDADNFKKIINEFTSIEVNFDNPKVKDKPPVDLQSNKIFQPFRLITRLYSYPAYYAYDPTAATAIFFALFLGICITDAAYGVLMFAASLVLYFFIKKFKDFSELLAWGALFSILAGVLTGGYFGDLATSRLGHEYSFIAKLLWFDPFREPLVFFRLVLGLGVLHVLTGLTLGVISSLKMKDYAAAIYDNFCWIVLLVSLIVLLFSSDYSVKMGLVAAAEPLVSEAGQLPAKISAVFSAFLIFLFSAREQASWGWRIFLGMLRLLILNGFFSYVADILSYIRLMALGMVTAGIAMAINNISQVIWEIPVVGVTLAIAVFASGHLFNIFISVLSGFVHTLRLQYVEFFSKFFISGGRPFKPFSESARYVKFIG
jgi:V/A-type H+-transporting ATPase subunit I